MVHTILGYKIMSLLAMHVAHAEGEGFAESLSIFIRVKGIHLLYFEIERFCFQGFLGQNIFAALTLPWNTTLNNHS
jgi:hypothetical protein